MVQLPKLMGVVLAILGVSLVAGQPAMAQSNLDVIIEKAGEEGAVVVNLSTTRYPAATAPALSKAISEKFGIDLKIELINTAPAPVGAGQLIAESKAGVKPSYDVFPLPLSFTKAIGEANAIEKIDWAGIGVDPDLIGPNGNAVWIYTIPRAVVYNTELVTGDDIPTKLEDLLDPQWKGKIAGPGFGDAYGMISAPVLGEEKAAEWVEALYKDQELSIVRSMTDITNKVANGEMAIGMGVPANYAGLVTKGAPVANAPLEKVGGQPYYIFVAADAAHPNAGALLSYFLCCTEEGRSALLENTGSAFFNTPGSEAYDMGSDGRGITPTTEWQLNDQARVAKRFDALIGR